LFEIDAGARDRFGRSWRAEQQKAYGTKQDNFTAFIEGSADENAKLADFDLQSFALDQNRFWAERRRHLL